MVRVEVGQGSTRFRINYTVSCTLPTVAVTVNVWGPGLKRVVLSLMSTLNWPFEGSKLIETPVKTVLQEKLMSEFEPLHAKVSVQKSGLYVKGFNAN